MTSSGPQWIVTASERRPDGRVDVTYSLASGVRYVTTIVPGTDIAAAIHAMGEHLAQTYRERGYL